MITSKTKNVLQDAEGSFIVEYALVVPLLLYLVLGIVEFSVVMFGQVVLQSATLAAAREGSTGCGGTGNPSCVLATLQARAGGSAANGTGSLFNAANLGICVQDYGNVPSTTAWAPPTPPACAAGATPATLGVGGDVVIYTATYKWAVITPFLSKILGNGDGTFTLIGTALVQNQPW